MGKDCYDSPAGKFPAFLRLQVWTGQWVSCRCHGQSADLAPDGQGS